MLSPHELATLLLIHDGPAIHDPRELDPIDLGALVAKDLVILEPTEAHPHSPRLTCHGQSMLKAMGRER